jgi:hypothetical protein
MQHDDLEVLLRSRVPLIAVESRDESEVLKALLRACARLPVKFPVTSPVATVVPAAGMPFVSVDGD